MNGSLLVLFDPRILALQFFFLREVTVRTGKGNIHLFYSSIISKNGKFFIASWCV